MKQVQKILFAIVLAALFTSCQSGTDAKKYLPTQIQGKIS